MQADRGRWRATPQLDTRTIVACLPRVVSWPSLTQHTTLCWTRVVSWPSRTVNVVLLIQPQRHRPRSCRCEEKMQVVVLKVHTSGCGIPGIRLQTSPAGALQDLLWTSLAAARLRSRPLRWLDRTDVLRCLSGGWACIDSLEFSYIDLHTQ